MRVELGKGRHRDGTLTVENVLRRVLLELGVPHQAHAVRVVGRLGVFVVRRHHQLGVDARPVHARHHSRLGPALVVEEPVEGQPHAGLVTVGALAALAVIAASVVDEQVGLLPQGSLDQTRRPVEEPLKVLRHDNHLLLLLAQLAAPLLLLGLLLGLGRLGCLLLLLGDGRSHVFDFGHAGGQKPGRQLGQVAGRRARAGTAPGAHARYGVCKYRL